MNKSTRSVCQNIVHVPSRSTFHETPTEPDVRLKHRTHIIRSCLEIYRSPRSFSHRRYCDVVSPYTNSISVRQFV